MKSVLKISNYLKICSTSWNLHVCVCVCVRVHERASAQLHPTLYDPADYSPPGSSVHGILQARILEWVAMSSSSGSSRPGVEPTPLASPALAGGFLTTCTTWSIKSLHLLRLLRWQVGS